METEPQRHKGLIKIGWMGAFYEIEKIVKGWDKDLSVEHRILSIVVFVCDELEELEKYDTSLSSNE